jgi:hypothetical protein
MANGMGSEAPPAAAKDVRALFLAPLVVLLVGCAHAAVMRQEGGTYRLVATCTSVEQALVRFDRTARRTCGGPRYRMTEPVIAHEGIGATPFGPKSQITFTADLVCDDGR